MMISFLYNHAHWYKSCAVEVDSLTKSWIENIDSDIHFSVILPLFSWMGSGFQLLCGSASVPLRTIWVKTPQKNLLLPLTAAVGYWLLHRLALWFSERGRIPPDDPSFTPLYHCVASPSFILSDSELTKWPWVSEGWHMMWLVTQTLNWNCIYGQRNIFEDFLLRLWDLNLSTCSKPLSTWDRLTLILYSKKSNALYVLLHS